MWVVCRCRPKQAKKDLRAEIFFCRVGNHVRVAWHIDAEEPRWIVVTRHRALHEAGSSQSRAWRPSCTSVKQGLGIRYGLTALKRPKRPSAVLEMPDDSSAYLAGSSSHPDSISLYHTSTARTNT
jgi:hypothetical protein